MKFVRPAHAPLWVALALAGTLSACGPSDQQQAAGAAPAVQVGTYQVQAQTVTLTSDLPGRVTAHRVAEVRPQVTGIIEKRLFAEGTEVKQGQPLFQIDADVYRAQLAKAEANLRSTQGLAKRYEALRGSNAISQQQYEDAQAAYMQSRAEVDLARINIKYTQVLSPISGRIGRSLVSEGALVTNGQAQPLAIVQQLDPIYVDVSQSSAELLKLRQAMESGQLKGAGAKSAEVRLTLEDGSAYSQTGTLSMSEVEVDPTTGSVILRATFPNTDGVLLPGMFVHASFTAGVREEAIVVPQQAVSRNAKGEALVWVVGSDNLAQPRPIKALRTIGNTWLVGNGLKVGETIITEGFQKLRPGLAVNPVPATNIQINLDLATPPAK